MRASEWKIEAEAGIDRDVGDAVLNSLFENHHDDIYHTFACVLVAEYEGRFYVSVFMASARRVKMISCGTKAEAESAAEQARQRMLTKLYN